MVRRASTLTKMRVARQARVAWTVVLPVTARRWECRAGMIPAGTAFGMALLVRGRCEGSQAGQATESDLPVEVRYEGRLARAASDLGLVVEVRCGGRQTGADQKRLASEVILSDKVLPTLVGELILETYARREARQARAVSEVAFLGRIIYGGHLITAACPGAADGLIKLPEAPHEACGVGVAGEPILSVEDRPGGSRVRPIWLITTHRLVLPLHARREAHQGVVACELGLPAEVRCGDRLAWLARAGAAADPVPSLEARCEARRTEAANVPVPFAGAHCNARRVGEGSKLVPLIEASCAGRQAGAASQPVRTLQAHCRWAGIKVGAANKLMPLLRTHCTGRQVGTASESVPSEQDHCRCVGPPAGAVNKPAL